MDNLEKLEALRTRLFTAPTGPETEVSINADLAYWLLNSAEACKSWLDKTAWVQEHASTFGTSAIGHHIADVMTDEIHRARGEANDWHKACQGLESLVKDIGTILGADMPRELVTEVARRRMEEIRGLRENVTRYEAQMLRMSTCAGEFAKEAAKLAPADAVPAQAGMQGDLGFDAWWPAGWDTSPKVAAEAAWKEALAQRPASKDSERDAALEEAAHICANVGDGIHDQRSGVAYTCEKLIRGAMAAQQVEKGGA